MGKKKSKKADDYWDAEFEQDAAQLAADVAEAQIASPQPPVDAEDEKKTGFEVVEHASAVDAWDEEDGQGGLMAIMKRNKKNKKQHPAPSNSASQDSLPAEANGEVSEPVVKIKSKKEKEKERKERQKAAQKAQQQQQQQQQKGKQTSEDIQEKSEEKPKVEPVSPAKDKKKKKGPPVAALREMLAQKQKEEEERARLEEEARKAEEERIRKIEEEERLAADRRAAKKERERLKKEQLRKEGKLLSKAEKERQRMAQLRLEQMMAAGVVIPALEEGGAEEAPEKKKRVVYDNRKKKGKKQEEKQPEPEPEPETEPVKEAKMDVDEKPDEDEVPDSWEEVADSWEDLADEEGGADQSAVASDKVDSEDENESNEDEDEDEDSEESDESDSEESDDGMTAAEREAERRKAEAKARREERHEQALAQRSKDDLRSPICVILGHVDTGKTKLLDKIRQTNVQEGEAGGITQQIGATYFPTDAIMSKTSKIKTSSNYTDISAKTGFSREFEIRVPGLLVIDTPGHESFTNLRSRGSSLCNIAILVVDIMHGLEQQTLESINLLKQRKTPFIVALNKIDRIYGWKETKDNPFLDSFNSQVDHVKREFEDRLEKTKLAFAEQGLNAEVYYKNPDVRKFVSLVPTSAITGEGVPDLLSLLVQLTQERMADSLMYLSELEATVLEVKVVEGHGTTIDVVLSNGILHEGDRIVVCGLNGPIVTNIRALLTPQPMRELRVKSAYVHHKEIKAAMGVKIAAPDLEKAIAGSRLLVVTPDDDEEELKEEVMADLTDLFESVDKSGKGVNVQASTLGSLEALLSFLKDSKIPVAGINIGPVHRKDIMRTSVMLEHAKEFAVLLAFDVKVDKEAQEMADDLGIKIFRADIIYHLFDQFTAYTKEIKEQRKRELAPLAVWPCHLRIVPGCVFNKRDPIILGVDIVEGSLRIGTPICVPGRGGTVLGKVAGIEKEHKSVEAAKKGSQVAVRLESSGDPKSFGRHFDEKDELFSKISRQSIDVLKEFFRNDVSKDEWLLIKKLKVSLKIE